MAHSKLFSPSASSRWLNCTKSAKIVAELPNSSSPDADLGSVAHLVGETALYCQSHCERYIGTTFDEYPDIEVTREMADYVQVYCDYVNSIEGELSIEVEVDFAQWVHCEDSTDDGFGTSDAVVYNESSKTLYVIDLKYGKGVQVFAENNEQARMYALGCVDLYDMLGKEVDKIVIVIVQPRLEHIDEWTITKSDLYRFGALVSEKAEMILNDEVEFNAGEKQCKFCTYKAQCPALKKLTDSVVMDDFDNLDADKLTDHQLSHILNNKKLIISWLDAVEKYVSDKLERGEKFEGYKLVHGRSMRKWSDEGEASALLEMILGEDAFKRSLLTVPQAEKVLGKSRLNLIEDIVFKTDGKPTLVPESDKREAINVSPDDFDEVK